MVNHGGVGRWVSVGWVKMMWGGLSHGGNSPMDRGRAYSG